MARKVLKSHVKIENLKWFLTMNTFQALLVLNKFNIEMIILEIITICHQKEKVDVFYVCKPLILGIQTQYELLKSSWDRKKVVTSIISTSRFKLHYKHQTLLSYFYELQILSWFLLKESIGYLMKEAAHSPTT
jgi:hypothetical protein